MKSVFVRPARAWQKLKLAARLNTNVYLYGATGFGKTTLVNAFLKGKPAVLLSCADLHEGRHNPLPDCP
ncbi:MAG: hypothetical protein Q4C54_07970 [Clostridia bacterium]|nr:hypothetical protein [Clostridia bacterium]